MSDEDMYEDEDGEDEGEDADEDEDMDEDEADDGSDNVIVTKGAKRVAKQLAPEKKQKISENQAKPVKVAKETAKAIKEEPIKKEPSKKDVKKEAPVKKGEIKKEIKKEEPKKDIKKEAPKKENKQVLANGLIIEDVKVGTGPAAKSGKKIGMRYIGRLTTGKVFDKNTSGKPFDFNLGRGEVIKGWDLGIQGMQVGGERLLTIPSELA
jgi:FK506-binding nuclear protein